MKVTYLSHSSRIGLIVPIHALEDGEIGYCEGWDASRKLNWYVEGEKVFKSVNGAPYTREDKVHDFLPKSWFTRKVEIIA
jgi:hypothetical protein